MVKNNILTPVLAGVLGVAVVGSGIGYYAVNKNAGEDGPDTAKNTQSAKMEQVAANIDNTLDVAEKAMKGELDFAFDGKMVVTPGEYVAEESGMTISPVTMTLSAKQKGQDTGLEYGVSYGDKKLATLNAVYTRDGDTAYVQVPELSDAYLKVQKDKLMEYAEEESGMSYDEIISELRDQQADFDTEAFEKSLKDYEQIVKDNFPQVENTAEENGDIDGVSYSYTAKTYTITADDAQRIAVAVLERAKTDTALKGFYDARMEQEKEMYEKYEWDTSEIPTYEETIQEAIDDVKSELDDPDVSNDQVKLVTFTDAEDSFTGFTMEPIEDGESLGLIKFVMVDTTEAVGIDFSLDIEDDVKMTIYGALKDTDGATSGAITAKYGEGDESIEIILDYDNVKTVGDFFSGTIRTDFNYKTNSEYMDAFSGWFEMSSASTEDALDLGFEAGFNGKKIGNIKITGNKTEASDITVPDANAKTYDPTDEAQLEEYLAGADTEGFLNNVKSALGDELYNELFDSGYDYDDDYDYDWDDDDWDWDDEDWDWDTDATGSTAFGSNEAV